MPTFILTSGSYIEQTLSVGQMGVVGVNAIIVANDARGIAVTGVNGFGSATVNVYGGILSTFQEAISSLNTNLRLFVGAEGLLNAGTSGVGSFSCVTIQGGSGTSEVDNLGTIQSHSVGIYFQGAGVDAKLDLFNSGTITGSFAAVSLTSGGGGTIYNSGTLLGDSRGIYGTISGDVLITNYGQIIGATNSVYTAGGDDRLVNRGDLLGDVYMGNGNDILDNRTGTIDGLIDLAAGNDTFILGAGAEIADGGAGTQDMIDARTGAGGVIDLAEDRSTGLALGDVLTGFERAQGSASGADTIYGNSSNNVFSGFGGNDLIEGEAGADIIYGGRGVDTLTGGVGNETFGFLYLQEFGDVITDFSSTEVGNDDHLAFRAVNIGGGRGTLNPTQFQTRADNVAQDANDRFIYRTTDRTLWFDADGNGAGVAVLATDLQSGASLTAADIFLI